MSFKPYGMFGPQGLLAKIEAEENNDSSAYLVENEVPGCVAENSKSEANSRPIIIKRGHESTKSVDLRAMNVYPLMSTENTNVASLVTPLNDLPPMDAAFSIETISKRIFCLLEPEDLLECRLVSTSWLRMATIDKLVKSEPIEIEYNMQRNDPVVVTVKGSTIRLDELADFIDGLGSHPCPYSAVVNLDMTIAQNDFFEFLDRYGFLVNSLEVTFQAKENGQDFVYRMKSLLLFVMNLLKEQLPNLETLSLNFEENAMFAGEIDSQLLISIKNGSYCAGKQNQSLRNISFGEQTPYEIIDAVCSLAPKLEQLKVPDLGFYVKNKHRLYLLKELAFSPSLENWDEVDSLEAIISTEEKLYLKMLEIDFLFVRDNQDLWPRLANVITKTFDRSCRSLEKLVLGQMYFSAGTVLPRMPKLVQLCFFQSGYDKPEWNFLPQGTSVANTFPMLHTITCYGTSSVTQLLSLCNKEEVTSVKRIFTVDADFDEKILQTMFPNAQVTEQ